MWTHLSLFAIRNVAIFSVIAIPCFALVINKNLDKLNNKTFDENDNRYLQTELNAKYHVIPFLVILFLIVIALNNGYLFDKKIVNCNFPASDIPVKAMEYVKEHPIKGNMLNQDNWGGYIMYAYPGTKVFMDGRLDMYQQDFLDQYQKVARATLGWQEILDKYDVQWIVFNNKTALHNLLDASPDWDVYYRDELATVFIRSNKL